MTTTIYKSRIELPRDESREWLRPLSSGTLTRLTEVANHLLVYNSALSLHHCWGAANFDEVTVRGQIAGNETLRVGSATGFFANPNLVNPTEAPPWLTADADGLIVEQIELPYTSPFCSALQLVFRFQAHEKNLLPTSSFYSSLFRFPYRIPAEAGTDGNVVFSIMDFSDYVGNPSSTNYTGVVTGNETTGFNYPADNRIPGSTFVDCDIRFRLKDKDGTIVDPASGSGWAVTLTHSGSGLAPGQGITRAETTDAFPVREISLSARPRSPTTSSLAPRALNYGAKAKSGEKLTLEIGYRYARPLSLSINEVPPILAETSNFETGDTSTTFPADFPTSDRPQQANFDTRIIFAYEGHLYIYFSLGRSGEDASSVQNGLVFFPEPPKSVWPLGGVDLSGPAADANPNLFYGTQADNAFANTEATYFGERVDRFLGGELHRYNPGSEPAYSGTPSPGEASKINRWLTSPASNPEFATMGDMVLANGGKVWHSALGNWPSDIVLYDHPLTYPHTVNATESGTRQPHPKGGTGHFSPPERAMVRVSISSITAWGGTLTSGDIKSAATFGIYNDWIQHGESAIAESEHHIFHGQAGIGAGGFADKLLPFFGLASGSSSLANYSLADVKAQFDAMGVP